MNWEKLESEIDILYSDASGQPPLPTRLLVGLHYLKYTFNESDESVVRTGLKIRIGSIFVDMNIFSTTCRYTLRVLLSGATVLATNWKHCSLRQLSW